MKSLSELGFSSWVDAQKNAQYSCVFLQFKTERLDLDALEKSVQAVVDGMDVFGMVINKEGFLCKRHDGSLSIILDFDAFEYGCFEAEQTVQHENVRYCSNALLSDSVFLVFKCFKGLDDDYYYISFLANMAVINPLNLYDFIFKVAEAYEATLPDASLESFGNSMLKIQTDRVTLGSEKVEELSDFPMPSLPWNLYNHQEGRVRNICWSLSHDKYRLIKQMTASNAVSTSDFFRTVFFVAVALYTGENEFRINLPFFKLNDVDPEGHQKYVENFYIQAVEVFFDKSLKENIDCLSSGNRLYGSNTLSGLELLRELARYTGAQEIAPLVYTDLLSVGVLFGGAIKNSFGKLNCAMSRGANVAIDIQVAELTDGIYFNWDINEDLIKLEMVKPLSNIFQRLLDFYIDNPVFFLYPLKEIPAKYYFEAQISCHQEALKGNGLLCVAGQQLSEEELQLLLERILERKVKLFSILGNEQRLRLLVEFYEGESVSVHEIQNILASHFLGQLKLEQIFLVSAQEFEDFSKKEIFSNEEELSRGAIETEQGCGHSEIAFIIALIFSKALGKSVNASTMADTDFFVMGGNSLLATTVVIEINKYFLFTQIGIADLFRLRSITEISNYLYAQNPELALRTSNALISLLK